MEATSGAYWLGRDGNYYLRANNTDGVVNLGKSPSNNQNFVDMVNVGAYSQIDDPNVRQDTAPAPGGGGGSSRPALNQALVNNTQAQIDQMGSLLADALAAENQRYSNVRGDFDRSATQERSRYDEGSTTNMQNYDRNLMSSVRAGAQGLGGLMSLLGGAATGTAGRLAEGAVEQTTNRDIMEGLDTRRENQGALDSSFTSFTNDLERRRREAEDTRANNERAIRRDNATGLQDLYSRMAGYYADAGRDADATNWINRSTELVPQVAANQRLQVSDYNATPVTMQAPEITAFAGPTQPNVTAVTGNDRIGAGIFSLGNRDRERRREQNPVGV